MKIFLDESGAFGWRSPGVSLFCGLIVPDRAEPALLDRFGRWRWSMIGSSARELKGSELDDSQLSSFAARVLPHTDRDLWLVCRGIDTSLTQEDHVLRLRDQASIMLDESSNIMKRHGNTRLQEQYRQMSGWIGKRSAQNVLWMIGAVDAILDALTGAVVRFAEPEDDAEFEHLEITLDQSFIKRHQHHDFWHEWLRMEITKSSRERGIPNIREWRERNHPFYRKTRMYPNVMNLRSVINDDLRFGDSKATSGLQIADICANILLRHHRRTGDKRAYAHIRPRIVGRDGAELHLTHVSEQSLHKDDPRSHAGVLDVEKLKRQADALGGRR